MSYPVDISFSAIDRTMDVDAFWRGLSPDRKRAVVLECTTLLGALPEPAAEPEPSNGATAP